MTCDWLEAMSLTFFDQSAASSYTVDDWINSDCLDCPTRTIALPGGPAITSSVTTPPLLAQNHAIFTPCHHESARRPPTKEPRQASQAKPWRTNFVVEDATEFTPTLPVTRGHLAFDEQGNRPSLSAGESQCRLDHSPDFHRAISPTPSLSGPESPSSRHEHDLDISPTAAASSRLSWLKRSAPCSPSMGSIYATKHMYPNQSSAASRVEKQIDRCSLSLGAPSRPTKTRQPHNKVEKKYREGLNHELERLRRSVRTLPQSRPRSCSASQREDAYGGCGTATPKPSKAAVLAGAVEYIKHLEAEHDRLANENEQLRELENLRRRRHDGSAWSGQYRMDLTN